MERIFEVEGIPNITLLYRGMMLRPNQKFKVKMTADELNCFSQFISVIDSQELKEEANVSRETQISEPIIEPKQENKSKEIKANDGTRKKATRQTKV